jgi:hypothetical protein
MKKRGVKNGLKTERIKNNLYYWYVILGFEIKKLDILNFADFN